MAHQGFKKRKFGTVVRPSILQSSRPTAPHVYLASSMVTKAWMLVGIDCHSRSTTTALDHKLRTLPRKLQYPLLRHPCLAFAITAQILATVYHVYPPPDLYHFVVQAGNYPDLMYIRQTQSTFIPAHTLFLDLSFRQSTHRHSLIVRVLLVLHNNI